MTREEIEHIVQETVRSTIKEIATQVGIDAGDPIEMQKDFHHLRAWRQSTESIKNRTMIAIIGVIVTGGAGLLWLAIKSALGK